MRATLEQAPLDSIKTKTSKRCIEEPNVMRNDNKTYGKIHFKTFGLDAFIVTVARVTLEEVSIRKRNPY